MVRRLSLYSLLLATMLAALSTAAGGAAAKPWLTKAPKLTPSSPVTRGSTYLALGDSVTFGFQEPSTTPAANYHNAASFPGFPEQIAQQLKLKVVNLACPAETSGSLINVSAPSLGCQIYRKKFPLHVSYRGSQLSYAIRFLRSHPGVRLVSLMIGANDGFLNHGITAAIARNVHRILSAVRKQAHYNGQIVVVNYFSLNYSSAAVDAQSLALNRAQDSGAKPFHVVFANGYAEFQAASVKYANQPCLAGLITQLNATVGNCGIHPSSTGQTLLAASLLKAIRL